MLVFFYQLVCWRKPPFAPPLQAASLPAALCQNSFSVWPLWRVPPTLVIWCIHTQTHTHKYTHTKYTQTHTHKIHTHTVSAALMSLLAKPRLLREVADDPSRAHYQPSPQPHSPTSEFTCYTSHMAYVSSPVIDFSLKSWQLTFVFLSFYA